MGTHQKLVDVHAGIDGDLATEIILKLLILRAPRRMICQQLRKPLPRRNDRVTCMLLIMLCINHRSSCAQHAEAPQQVLALIPMAAVPKAVLRQRVRHASDLMQVLGHQ